jgi:hypothetical protein
MSKNSARQTRLVAVAEFDYTELPTGVAVDAVRLPAGAIILGGSLKNVTAGNSGTSDTLTVGDGSGASALLSGHNGQTATLNAALTGNRLGTEYAAADDITVTRTAVGAAATAGLWRLTVDYVIDGRVSEVQTG